jgi:hypothetical protein
MIDGLLVQSVWMSKWTTEKLLPIAEKQPSYFKDSFALKEQLDEVIAPYNALVWTADASVMYTYIKTVPALVEFDSYLRAEEGFTFSHYCPDSLMAALKIVFRNNTSKFGDTLLATGVWDGDGHLSSPPVGYNLLCTVRTYFGPLLGQIYFVLSSLH